jgi:hypothetical protein
MKNLKVTSGIDLEELKNYMTKNFSHITFDYSDAELVGYLNQNYVFKLGNNIPAVCNLLVDHLLANGECDVQE